MLDEQVTRRTSRVDARKSLLMLARTAAVVVMLVASPLPQSQAAPATTFVDINPDNEKAGFLGCLSTDPCSSQEDGGRVNGLAVVPDAPNIYFAASETGGMFKSMNTGASWFHLNGYLPAAAWDVAVEPGGQRVFATSFNEGRRDTQAVLQVSTDGGVTWSGRLPAAPSTCSSARTSQPSAYGIALRPGTSDVLVGTNCGLAVSKDAGDSWNRFDPTADTEPSNVWDVVALPGGRTYACGDDGLLTSPDGQPSSWVSLGTPSTPAVFPGGYCSLAVSPEDPNVVFVAFATATFFGDLTGVGCCNFPPSGGSPGVYGGPEFYEAAIDLDGTPQVTWIRLPYPDDVGGGDAPDTTTKKGRVPIVKTNDRPQGFDLWIGDGSLWSIPCSGLQSPSCTTDTTQWTGSFSDHIGDPAIPGDEVQKAHGDSGDIAFDPDNGCPTLYSSDGGVYANSSPPSSCQDPVFVGANVGLHAFLLWDMEGVSIAGADDEDIYLATQDNGFYYTLKGGTSAPSWFHPLGGDANDVAADGSVVAVAPANYLQAADRGYQNVTNVIPSGFTSLSIPDVIASVGSGRFAVVVPAATTWKGTSIAIGVRDITDIKNAPLGSPWGGVGGGTWTSTKSPCHVVVGVGPGGAQPYVLAGNCFWPASGRVGPGALPDDELWTYKAGAWTPIPAPSWATGFGLIAVDPVNPERLYASVFALDSPRMIRSINGGSDWEEDVALTDLMMGNGTFIPYPAIPEDRVFPNLQPLIVAFDREDPNILVAGGMYSGVFLSVDAGASWSLLTDPFTSGVTGIPHLPRVLFAHFDHDKPGVVRIYLGTGRGVWRVDLEAADLSVTKNGSPDPVVTGSDVTYAITVQNNGTNPGASLTLTDELPANFTFQSLASAAGWSCTTPQVGSGGTLTCSESGLPVGAIDTFSLVAKVDCSLADGALVTNSARIASTHPDPALGNNTAVEVTSVSNPPPSITCPAGITVECTGNCGIQATDPQLAPFFAGASANDNCPGVIITNDAPAFLPLGTTTVTFTATDSGGASASCPATVTVVDTIPPQISVTLSRDLLWPPNHKLVDITATVNVTDVCDPHATFVLTSIASSEPDDGLGDGDTANDIQSYEIGTADTSFQLRSERSGLGSGRVYTIVYTASDKSGNTAQASATVNVPHDRSGHAQGGAGFNSLGTMFLANARTFDLVVASTSLFDARRIDPKKAQIGNSVGVINVLQSRAADMTGDGKADVILTYSMPDAQRLRASSDNSLAFRFGTVDGTYYLVPDIFNLGKPLQTKR